jgi:N-methylhydantoinase B
LILDNGSRPNPKALLDLEPGQVVHPNLPGGGGFGDPFNRDAELIRQDVISGYITVATAERDYGVVVRYTGKESELVRLPEQWVLDEAETKQLRDPKVRSKRVSREDV